ncbi:hypothetical protein M707_02610 [Arthrobacter sp. AK-YN10]|nr:hypothetical protein M707_02610 [Arthrobacter sp. AK-YN10]
MSKRDELTDLIAKVTVDVSSGVLLRVHPDGITPVFEADQRVAEAVLPLLAAAWQEGRQAGHDHMIGKQTANPYDVRTVVAALKGDA